jgi:hypothetical protein
MGKLQPKTRVFIPGEKYWTYSDETPMQLGVRIHKAVEYFEANGFRWQLQPDGPLAKYRRHIREQALGAHPLSADLTFSISGMDDFLAGL